MLSWITIAVYLAVMFALSALSARKGHGDFYARGKSPGWMVAVAMIGACMSGVSYVSVPGMVGVSGWGYLQMCLGFIAGYCVIALVLIPLYYRLQVVSIYEYLDRRFGTSAYRTGAWFFFVSKLLGASVRMYLLCIALQLLLFDPLGLPFALNVVLSVAVIFAYTFRGGVGSVMWNDVLKTVCMVVSVGICIIYILSGGVSVGFGDGHLTRIFYFDDVNHPQFFWKQFAGGFLTVIAMTGLDQDMMQRALSGRNSRSSQRSLMVSVFLQVAVIFLFLVLGVLLYRFAELNGIPERGDLLFPAVATSGLLPPVAGVLFVLGLVSAGYGAGGSALTSLTTSFSRDILGVEARKSVHAGMAAAMVVTILIFSALNSTSAIDAVYRLASYTYGPLLGLFAFGILVKREIRGSLVPLVAVVAPLLCLLLQLNSERWFGGYSFSYEILFFNAAFTFAGLCCLIRRSRHSGGPSRSEVRASSPDKS
ncbi:MAG: sodium:solute symporter [Bacteroidales bacterium]|nr:sodium:solute symporter [Bacteroidales bacterium]